MANFLWRTLVITHRYLGIAAGLLMLMWFASGIIMIYVGLPTIQENERMRTLAPISWGACCRFGEPIIPDTEAIARAQIENLAGVPTIRLQRAGQRDSSLDLSRAVPMRIDADQAQAIVRDAAPRIIGQPAKVVGSELAQTDQWSIGRLIRDRPLYRFEFDDPERTNIYVSSSGGQVVLWTTVTQRFWNWLGTIPHFLYFVDLRSNPPLWSQVVIWTSIVGAFLTALGLYLGIAQFRRGQGGKLSPYRGWFYWHHMAGLVFGVVALTWAFSGTVSMNPWGFLESQLTGAEVQRLRGQVPRWGDIRNSVMALREQPAIATAVSLVTVPLAGQLYWRATLSDGSVVRLDAAGHIAAPAAADLTQAAARIAGSTAIAEQGLLDKEDAYYFERRRVSIVLPVYRIILGDEDSTRFYLDPRTGAMLQQMDSNTRWHRWLFGGLHRIDFTAGMRTRPIWDIIVLILLLGGLGVTATGVYLAARRIKNDFVMLLRLVGRRRTAAKASVPGDQAISSGG
jgi:PepSY-associated TM region